MRRPRDIDLPAEQTCRDHRDVDVSVIIPFGDDEDRVGRVVRRIADHLRSLGRCFELLAVDELSGDNSVTLLGLLRGELPELRILIASGSGRGFFVGSRAARGRALLLVDIEHGDAPLAPFGWALARVERDLADVVIVPERFVACRRTRAWGVMDGVRGRGRRFERRVLWRAVWRRLRVELPPRAGQPQRIAPFRLFPLVHFPGPVRR